ncbi:MAG TPA: MltA domain-containing protein [Syntrophales bacterium]|jgi:membrane-bound lytic murein transglycosylase A|nr:MltA domain-containing protein [Syntrophales bacterium]HQJ29885.1 MltA domain-containing protein [Syntrophales bacterium]
MKMMPCRLPLAILLLMVLFLTTCRPAPGIRLQPEQAPVPVPFPMRTGETFPDDLDLVSLEKALTASVRYYRNQGAFGSHCYRSRCYNSREMIAGLERFLQIMKSDLPAAAKEAAIREDFELVEAGDSDEDSVLVTGYYEPVLNGSLERTERFRYPLYKPPEETVVVRLDEFGEKCGPGRLIGRLVEGEVLPHYTRREIDSEGALAGRGLEIAWVDDPVALFSLHIQGSGKLRLADGRLMAVNFAQSNGRPFRGLTEMMAARGLLGEGGRSYEEMKRVLNERVAERQELMNYNERYIFFRFVSEGPIGALGFPLVPGRSIATDLTLYPKGALAVIRTRKPVFDTDGRIVSWQSFTRFVLNQDTGAAIKGPGRVDLFCGQGPAAERAAGAMKEKGRLTFLLLKTGR